MDCQDGDGGFRLETLNPTTDAKRPGHSTGPAASSGKKQDGSDHVENGWSTHSGDYHCFVRTSTGMWYSLDDSRVFQVSERTVLDQKAYMLFYVLKQNLVASSIAKKICSSISQDLKETIQSRPVGKSFSGADASVAVTQNDVSNVGLPKEILSREASAPKSSRFSSDCLALTNGPMSEPSPNVALSKHWVMGLSVLNPTLEKSMPPSAPSVKGSSITNLDSAVAASIGAKFNGCSEH
ncbi:hypothetical protein PVL29_001066 [Vitis rotundifolia]|uniref:USP domain-containing protein n=1 Tax=Vitis rotundifolia TaxID=103349 RepID=A0AA39ANG9_VITRO|nr:hypothetical protein PVL29_001066 [Vitis rotundifolia]